MPIPVNCPQCQAAYNLVDSLAGKAVRCQKCKNVFQVPGTVEPILAVAVEGPPPLPAQPVPPPSPHAHWESRRQRRDDQESAGTPVGWIIGLTLGGVVLLVGLMILILFLVQGDSQPLGDQILNVPFQQTGTLDFTSPRHRQRRSFHHVYQVQLQAGANYQFDMVSNNMDCFLILENSTGMILTQDDDGGDALNARIRYRCPTTGTYRLITTTCGQGDQGGYFLTGQFIP